MSGTVDRGTDSGRRSRRVHSGDHGSDHGVLGAVGGCIAGHQWHKHTVREQDLQNEQDYVRRRQQFDPSYKDPWQGQ